jgi:hypothetical protein
MKAKSRDLCKYFWYFLFFRSDYAKSREVTMQLYIYLESCVNYYSKSKNKVLFFKLWDTFVYSFSKKFKLTIQSSLTGNWNFGFLQHGGVPVSQHFEDIGYVSFLVAIHCLFLVVTLL